MQNKTQINDKNQRSFPSAQLWIGQHEKLVTKAKEYLQALYCDKKRACRSCIQCTQIQEKEHHATLWLLPEKRYTLDQLSLIFNIISFRLEPGENFFFVIQKADHLPIACANSLLKSIEEPPDGYHFILLAERQENILPTIISRCVTQYFHGTNSNTVNRELYKIFTLTGSADPNLFLKILDQSKITEAASIDLLDELLLHWLEINKTALLKKDRSVYKKAQLVIAAIKGALEKPLMPGSSKMLWKNLFIEIRG